MNGVPEAAYATERASGGRKALEPTMPWSMLRATCALYVLTFRQHLHGRRWMVVSGMFLLPALLAVLIRSTAEQVPSLLIEFLLVFLLIPHALVPIVALTYASGIFQDEQEEQTLTYLLIRPIPRWAIYFVKLLATITTCLILTSIFTAVTFAAIYAGTAADPREVLERCLKAVAVHDLAVVAYCCLFGTIGLVTSRTLVIGILYTVIFEGIVANMPFSLRLLTVIYYGRSIAYQWMPFAITIEESKQDVAANAWNFKPNTPAEMTSIPDCILVVLGASAVLAAIASTMCARREFNVKTPEVN